MPGNGACSVDYFPGFVSHLSLQSWLDTIYGTGPGPTVLFYDSYQSHYSRSSYRSACHNHFLPRIPPGLCAPSKDRADHSAALDVCVHHRCGGLSYALPDLPFLGVSLSLPATQPEDQKPVSKAGRIRGSGPILILAVLFVAATFLAWYFTWFGRELSDADISKYLQDEKNPRHVQHALLQIQQRIDRGDPSAKNWYPQIITLSGSAETEFRLTVAWLMGFDTRSPEFHEALGKLLQDQAPIVRRNAALALVRFNDSGGRTELLSILDPFLVRAPEGGLVASTLREGAQVARGTLLARIQESDGKVIEVRSPLQGRIKQITKGNGAQVSANEELLSLYSDELSVWESLRALAFVGVADDVEKIQAYTKGTDVSNRVKEQAELTVKSIQSRSGK